jgi:hypothetical protein
MKVEMKEMLALVLVLVLLLRVTLLAACYVSRPSGEGAFSANNTRAVYYHYNGCLSPSDGHKYLECKIISLWLQRPGHTDT